jgi:hypothetical protein
MLSECPSLPDRLGIRRCTYDRDAPTEWVRLLLPLTFPQQLLKSVSVDHQAQALRMKQIRHMHKRQAHHDRALFRSQEVFDGACGGLSKLDFRFPTRSAREVSCIRRLAS